jgi:hypothetical protein
LTGAPQSAPDQSAVGSDAGRGGRAGPRARRAAAAGRGLLLA